MMVQKSVASHKTPRGKKSNEAASAMLGLTPSQSKELEFAIMTFLDQLRAEEVRRAYVLTTQSGSEQIIVPSFDRSDTIKKVRSELTASFGESVADFVCERIPSDSWLAAGNDEMRAYIVEDDDGITREVFERNVLGPPVMLQGREVQLKTTVRTRMLMRDGHNARTKHLFMASAM